MSQPADPDDHPLLPDDEDSELRYDRRTDDPTPTSLGTDDEDE